MIELGAYRLFKLYRLDSNERDLLDGAGTHYVRNSIFVFLPDEANPTLGREWGVFKELDDAADAINKEIEKQRVSVKERIAQIAAQAVSQKFEEDAEWQKKKNERCAKSQDR